MKKTYIAPFMEATGLCEEEEFMNAVSAVGGTANIGIGEDAEEGLGGQVKGSIFDTNPWE